MPKIFHLFEGKVQEDYTTFPVDAEGVFKEILIGVYFTQPEKSFALSYFVQFGEQLI